MTIALTVDVVLLTDRGPDRQVLLIQRANPPFVGSWALPGGFLEEDESLADGAARELREETGIDIDAGELVQVGAFGAPGRDPRGPTVTVAFCLHKGGLDGLEAGGDDAADARWFPLEPLPHMAFDHGEIMEAALRRLDQDGRDSGERLAEFG